MHICTFYNTVEIHRTGKVIFARFLEPHLVLSTCRLKGGICSDLEFVLNHQACEPCGHHKARHSLEDPEGYRASICKPLGIPPEKCAMMSTAANMNNASFVVEHYGGLEVGVIATAGVETNAGRAGDPASVMETGHGFVRLASGQVETAKEGTINIMLFIGHQLTRAALVRSVITATEAKSSALQELSVNSRYSDGLATGTGTDQIIVAAPDRAGFKLSWAGKHSKLGELIGNAVKRAIKEALKMQNRLTPQGQCSCKTHLERFGCDKSSMLDTIRAFIGSEESAALLMENFKSIDRDPLTVSAVAAMAHLKDKFSWGILPHECWRDVMGAGAAHIACAVGGRWEKFAKYRELLGEYTIDSSNQSFLKLCFKAFALGFEDKWKGE